MSAIAGAIGGDPEEAQAQQIAILDAMAHRGPLQIGALRLAGARGAKTAFAEADGLAVAIDGDIHNRSELSDAGLVGTESPAETVLRCYRRWNVHAVGRMIGDFAFVLYDAARQSLLCARDAIGVRPLFYRIDKDRLLVASEAHALLAATATKQPNLLAVSLFASGEYSEDGYTLYDGVLPLPPAHYLHASKGGTSLHRYWEPNPWRKLAVDDREAAALFAETFREAVRCRMPDGADRLGIMLSGGLDSSAVACQASAIARARESACPTSLHISLAGWDCDETELSSAVASKWNMPTIDLAGDGEDMMHACRPHMHHPDVLYHASMACFDALFAHARRANLSKVMTGLGGDEWWDESGGECADALREADLGDVVTITGIGRAPWSSTGYRRLWNNGIKRLVPPRIKVASRRLRGARVGPPFLTKSWSKRVVEQLDEVQRRRGSARYPDQSSADMCAKLWLFNIRVGAAQVYLRGAATGLDVAHPFLDRRVFELGLAMPRRYRLRRGHFKNKPLLRDAMGGLLPVDVIRRRDAAEFSCYLRDVYLRHHRREIARLFQDSRLGQLGIVEVPKLQAALEAGLPDPASIKYFGLILSMELWLRQGWS